jgi:hypothetical protein
VKEAIRTDTIKVVSFDWLEDSLRLKKHLKERKYLMEVLHAKKSRQPKGGLSCNSKVTKSGRPSNSELASLFISHLNEYQGSRRVGRGGLRKTSATTGASATAAVKSKTKAKGRGKERNQERPVVTTTCPNTAVDLLEAHLRAQKEEPFAPKQQDEVQPTSTLTLPAECAEDEAMDSTAASPAYVQETSAELVDDQPMLIDRPDPLVSDIHPPFHSSTAPEPTNHEASQSRRSVAPSKTNTLPPLKKPPQANSSRDCWVPVDPLKYHIYKDGNGFEYSVTLVRIDIRRNSNERFILRLYESHISDISPPTGDEVEIEDEAEPETQAGTEAEDGHGTNTYTVWLRFVSEKKGDEPVVQCLADEGSEFENAMAVFQYAFRTWTGRRWEERRKNVKDGGNGGEGEDSGLDEQMEEHIVDWEDRVDMVVGLPSRDGVKSKPFVYVKPGVCVRSKGAFGLGGMPIAAKYAARMWQGL